MPEYKGEHAGPNDLIDQRRNPGKEKQKIYDGRTFHYNEVIP